MQSNSDASVLGLEVRGLAMVVPLDMASLATYVTVLQRVFASKTSRYVMAKFQPPSRSTINATFVSFHRLLAQSAHPPAIQPDWRLLWEKHFCSKSRSA